MNWVMFSDHDVPNTFQTIYHQEIKYEKSANLLHFWQYAYQKKRNETTIFQTYKHCFEKLRCLLKLFLSFIKTRYRVAWIDFAFLFRDN